MSQPVVEVHDEKLLKIGTDAGVEFCQLMAKEQAPCEGIVAITIKRPDPVLNLVVHAEVPEEGIDEKIQCVVDFYTQHKVAWTWVMNPLTRPANLAEHLERHDFAYLEEYPSMYFDLSKVLPQRPLKKFDIREANTKDQLREWIKPINEGFPSSDHGEGFHEVNALLPRGPGTSLRQLMILYKNQTVCAGTLYLHPKAAMIYNIATCHAARRRGFGTALTLHMMRLAKSLGYKDCFLDSSTSGFKLYHDLGFRVYAINKVYALKSLIK